MSAVLVKLNSNTPQSPNNSQPSIPILAMKQKLVFPVVPESSTLNLTKKTNGAAPQGDDKGEKGGAVAPPVVNLNEKVETKGAVPMGEIQAILTKPFVQNNGLVIEKTIISSALPSGYHYSVKGAVPLVGNEESPLYSYPAVPLSLH